MPYRMLLADLDGTVLTSQGCVTPRTAAVLWRLRDAGWRVVLATGRCWKGSRPVVDEIALGEPVICVGGALVKQPPDGRTTARAGLSPDLVRRAAEVIHGQGQSFFLHVDGPDNAKDALMVAGPQVAPETARYLEKTSWAAEADGLESLGDALEHSVEISVWAPRDVLETCSAALLAALPGELRTVIIFAPNARMTVLEVFASGVSKWAAGCRLARQWDIPPADVVAIGDDVNDVEMITHAGLGIAMGNAAESVRRIAARVAATNDQDGLAAAVETLL